MGHDGRMKWGTMMEDGNLSPPVNAREVAVPVRSVSTTPRYSVRYVYAATVIIIVIICKSDFCAKLMNSNYISRIGSPAFDSCDKLAECKSYTWTCGTRNDFFLSPSISFERRMSETLQIIFHPRINKLESQSVHWMGGGGPGEVGKGSIQEEKMNLRGKGNTLIRSRNPLNAGI